MRTTCAAWVLVLAAACGRSERRAVVACAPAVCEQRCEAGDAAACTRASELYFRGENEHALDHARSLALAIRACDGGALYGCTLAGYHHQDGLGTAWAPTRALALYERACDAGEGTACYNLATMYSGGHGVDPDPDRATAYQLKARAAWQRACDGREPARCANLGFWHETEAARDPMATATADELAGWYRRACAAGDMPGCLEDARTRVESGALTGSAWLAQLERWCDAGTPAACGIAGRALVQGEHVAADGERGLALLVRSCDRGDKDACMRIALMYGTGEGAVRDDGKALAAITRACDRAAPEACGLLVELQADRRDAAATIAAAQRACQMGHARSCTMLGEAYHRGIGVAADDREALRWSREGCRGGEPGGCGVLVAQGEPLPLPPRLRTAILARLCSDGLAAACAR
jgi:TPR repeat protein